MFWFVIISLSLPISEVIWGDRDRQDAVFSHGICQWRWVGWKTRTASCQSCQELKIRTLHFIIMLFWHLPLSFVWTFCSFPHPVPFLLYLLPSSVIFYSIAMFPSSISKARFLITLLLTGGWKKRKLVPNLDRSVRVHVSESYFSIKAHMYVQEGPSLSPLVKILYSILHFVIYLLQIISSGWHLSAKV